MIDLYSKKFQLCIDLLKSGHADEARKEFLGIKEPKIGTAKSQLYKKLKDKIIHGDSKLGKLKEYASESQLEGDVLPFDLITSLQNEHFMLDYFSQDTGVGLSLSTVDTGAAKRGVSIVTACMNREENLLKVLPSWLNTDVTEIIIVDWSSDQPLIDTLRRIGDHRIKVIRVDNEKKWVLTHAFNLGLKFASCSVVFKLDSDIEIKDNFFILNNFKDGEFIRGFWKLAVDSGDEQQKFVNGTFAAKKDDLRKIGYYDERIQTYGWDDSDIYYRLTLDHGLLGRFINPSSIYHMDQKESQRTEKQEVNKNLFLGRYQSTEYEGGKNKYLTINNTTWGDYFPFHDYQLNWKEKNYLAGIRATECQPLPDDLVELSEILSARQLLLWNAANLKSVPYEDQKRIDFAKLFSDAHKIGVSDLLFSAIKLGKGLHFILVDDEIINPAINKTVTLMRHHVEASKDLLVIVENSSDKTRSRDYLTAPRDLILRLTEALQAVEYLDVSRFEDRMATGHHTCTLTRVSIESLCKEATDDAKLFTENLKETFKPIESHVDNTCLVTSLYDEYNLIRLVEYFACLILNIKSFEKVVILYESRNNLFYSLISRYVEINNISPERIVITPFNKRPRFDELFGVGNQLKPGYMLAVVNADIAFDGTMLELARSIKENDFIVLSRRDVVEDGKSARLIRLDNGCPNTFSADAWIVKTPFQPDFNLDYEIGTMHCDSFINFQAGHSLKYQISNPCLNLHIYHLHDERFNSSEEKSVKDKEKIEKKYGEEWVRCGNQDPVRGVSWSGLKSSSAFNVQQKLQQWRPKTLVFKTDAHNFQIGALFLIHLLSDAIQGIEDIGVVVCLQIEEIDSSVEKLLSKYRKHFNKNIIIEANDFKFDPKYAEGKMCHTNSLEFDQIYDLLVTSKKEDLTKLVVAHTQWPGIEGIKLVRGEINLNISSARHLHLFNLLRNSFLDEFKELLSFLECIDRWDEAKNGILPLLESVKDCQEFNNLTNYNNQPVVTFITSLYRGGIYLQGYLNNVSIAASQCNGEVIIVDANCDGSESQQVKDFLLNNPGFADICTYIELDKDPGLYECWNLAIGKAQGRYITNANIDDRRSPFHTKKLAKFLDENEKYSAVSGDIFAVSKGDLENWYNILEGQIWYYDEGDFEVDFHSLFQVVDDGNVVSRNVMHCMPVWRKSLHDKYGLFSEEIYGTSADWEFWLRITGQGCVLYHCKDIFGLYLINPNSHNRRDPISLSKEARIISDRIQ